MKIIQEVDLRMALLLRRKQLGMKQADLAKMLGLSTMGLSYLERGTRKLKLETLDKWANTLGYEVKLELSLIEGQKKETVLNKDFGKIKPVIF